MDIEEKVEREKEIKSASVTLAQMVSFMDYYETTFLPLKSMHARGFMTTEQLESNLPRVFQETLEII